MSDFDKYNIPKLETIDVKCDKEQLLDYTWLSSNVPWSNHDGKNVKVTFDEVIKAYSVVIDVYDTKSTEIHEFEFDNVIIMAFHGVGTHYSFEFCLKDGKVRYEDDLERIGFSKEDVKSKYITQLERKIKSFQRQMGYVEDAIKSIKEL